MHCFPIHDIIDVIVSEDVSDELLSSIEFQMGYFRADAPSGCPLTLRVEPIEKASERKADTAFHLSWATAGEHVHMPSQGVGFALNGDCLTVYASHGSGVVMLGLQLMLVRSGASLIHAAALLEPDGGVLLIPGPGGVGKTTSVAELIRRGSHRLLGDDLVILGKNGEVYSFPRQMVLKEAHREQFAEIIAEFGESSNATSYSSWRSNRFVRRIMGILYRNAPFVGVIQGALWRAGMLEKAREWFLGSSGDPAILACVPPAAAFGKAAIAQRGRVSRVIFLERARIACPLRVHLPKDQLVRRCFAILHHELVDHMRVFWQLGSLEIFDLSEYFAGMYGVLNQGLEGVDADRLEVPERIGAEELGSLLSAESKELS